MARITGKSRPAIQPKVRQMRGPGMNKGLKKPRHGQFARPESDDKTPASARVAGTQGSSSNDYSKGTSYLSKNLWR